ncbi:MAG: hypothetical protein WD602_03125 [Actinomycetota bacterium]
MIEVPGGRVPFSEDELQNIREGARYGADFSKWMAGLATLAIGGAGIGLTDKVVGLGETFFVIALGAMVLSLIGATLCLLTLGGVVIVKADTTLAEFSRSSTAAYRCLTVQLWSFLAGITSFALTIAHVVTY